MIPIRLDRRSAMLALTAGLLMPAAHAQPQNPLHLVVPFAPGGASDAVGRVIGKRVGELLGRPVVVDNRPGAGGTIGIDYVARAPADGDTIVLVNAMQHAASPGLFPQLRYDVVKGFRPLAAIGKLRYLLVVNPSFPANDLDGFVRQVRAKPGGYSYASAGVGSAPHLAMELFLRTQGLSMVHVPYGGSGPAMNDLLGGQVEASMDNVAAIPLVKSGRLRALAITGRERSPTFPALPTFAETAAKDFEVVGVWGFLAPAKTPDAAAARLEGAIAEALKDPEVSRALVTQGIDPEFGDARSFGDTVRSELAKWSKLLQATGIRATS